MKQKMTTLVMSALALAMSLPSCTNDNDVPGANPGTTPVSFTAAIGQAAAVPAPALRAAGTQWAADDAIGIFMLPHDADATADPAPIAEAANRRFTTPAGDGHFAPATGHEIYYPMDDSPVRFVAYYPHAADAAWDATLPVSTAGTQTAASQAAIDYLWATANNQGNGYRKSAATAPVSLAFSHRLSKLTMHCKLHPSVGTVDPATLKVTIRGMKTVATFAPKTGEIGTPATPEAIVPRRLDVAPTDFHAAYDALILPAAYDANAVTVDFTLPNGETFTWHVDTVTFFSGKNHLYEVLVTRTGVEATGTIDDWEPEPMGEVEAE